MTAPVQPLTREELEAALREIIPQIVYMLSERGKETLRRIEATALASIEDRERLDWLEAWLAEQKGVEITFGSFDGRSNLTDLLVVNSTIRAAINAARKGVTSSGQASPDGEADRG